MGEFFAHRAWDVESAILADFEISISERWLQAADSDEVARVYRYEVARGFRDDVAHLSDLISPGGEAFWPVDSLALGEPHGQSGIAA
ncbi:hypothetical protein QA640_04545 [Bradyrhizobium sp. CB82]|uniref:hypothetical protein n=1 Tax=Bradyrhizobium sp. CB82 TaxID=3039159 RepID=UPI0024B1CFED|nr:hypothetical protein [Bradyrhizobium sp. CB82]WFU41787.1 hypothetical protein QA640_04545 [Bradyrhizobium sp. CB82]